MNINKEESYKQFLKCKKDNERFFNEKQEAEISATERYTPIGSITQKYDGKISLLEKGEIGIASIPVLKGHIFTDKFSTDEQEFYYEKESKKLIIKFNFNTAEPFARVLIEVQFPFI